MRNGEHKKSKNKKHAMTDLANCPSILQFVKKFAMLKAMLKQ